MAPKREIPETRELYTFSAPDESGELDRYAPAPMSDVAGLEGYAVPWFVLSDRGTFFVPGSFKKTIKEQLKRAPHLFQHWTDEVIGYHVNAIEDETGFRIAVAMNEDIPRAAEVMSNHRFAAKMGRQAYQFSVGIDRVAARTGTDEDDKKLNRKHAPAYLQNLPINELMAYTEVKWYEDSTVTFAGIGTAQPDIIHTEGPKVIAKLTEALKNGTVDDSTGRDIAQLAAAYQEWAAAADAEKLKHGTQTELTRPDMQMEIASRLARHAGLLAQGMLQL